VIRKQAGLEPRAEIGVCEHRLGGTRLSRELPPIPAGVQAGQVAKNLQRPKLRAAIEVDHRAGIRYAGQTDHRQVGTAAHRQMQIGPAAAQIQLDEMRAVDEVETA
jgi:hypothetical protein